MVLLNFQENCLLNSEIFLPIMEISSPCIFNKNHFMYNLSANKLSQSSVEIKNHYIASSVSERGNMENDFREHSAGKIAKKAFEISRAILIIGIGGFLLLGDKYNVPIVMAIDPILKYGFGGMSILYGSFRLYRGIKGDNYL
jgi:hypothetical protein